MIALLQMDHFWDFKPTIGFEDFSYMLELFLILKDCFCKELYAILV